MNANPSSWPARPTARRTLIGVLSLLAVGSTAGYTAGRAHATGVPTTTPLTYSGILTDANGAPLPGPKNIQLVLWDQTVTGGTPLCTAPPMPTPLTAGAFQLILPADCTTVVHGHPDLWSEIFVDGAPLGRTKLGAVPFALEADTAVNAGGALGTRLDNVEARIAALEGQPAGKVAGIWMASPPYAAGHCVSIMNTPAWTDIAETTVTFDVAKAVTIFATYSINVQPDAPSGDELVGTHLVVDGTFAESSGSHYQPYSGSTGDTNVNLSGNFAGDLAAGSHSIKLQWSTGGAARTWNNCPGPEWGAGGAGSIAGRTVVVVAVYK